MTARPLRARYVGYTTGTENHGDEALIWIIRDLLAPEIHVSCDAETFDVALLGGGTLINQSPWLIDHYQSLLDRAPRGGIVFGSGVGDTAFWGDHFARWNALLARCRFVGVRGPDSLALLRANGFDAALDIGDPYLALRSPLERPPVPRLLGVNFGTANRAIHGGDEEGWLDRMTEVLTRLRGEGWSFVWLSVWSKDLPILQAARARVGEDSGPLYDARTQCLEALAALAGCEAFLGEKLHAIAMAAVAGVPFVALEYQPKVRDFTRSLDMDEWTISTAERDAAALGARVEELARRRNEVRARLLAARDERRRRILAFAQTIRRHFAEGAG